MLGSKSQSSSSAPSQSSSTSSHVVSATSRGVHEPELALPAVPFSGESSTDTSVCSLVSVLLQPTSQAASVNRYRPRQLLRAVQYCSVILTTPLTAERTQ